MKTHIIYHNDADGYCSGAIAYKYYTEEAGVLPEDIRFHSVRYGDEFPKEVTKQDTVVILDFSFPMEVMEDLSEGRFLGTLIWIDHHKTSFEDMVGYSHAAVRNIAGKRIDSSKEGQRVAACELTWEYFYPSFDPPLVARLVGAYDTWRYTELSCSNQNRILNTVAGCYDLPDEGNINNPDSLAVWIRLLRGVESSYTKIYADGAAARKRTEEANAKICGIHAFETIFEGYKAIAANADVYSSLLFKSVYDSSKHDLMVVFSYQKEGFWKVSVYSENPKIDCGALCRRLYLSDPNPSNGGSGGGHVGAAGFQGSWQLMGRLFTKGGL